MTISKIFHDSFSIDKLLLPNIISDNDLIELKNILYSKLNWNKYN